MPNIITLTANLLAETTYNVSNHGPGKTSRATSESFQVGGKGINVAKMLLRLGAKSTAICFPGGVFGPPCESWLKRKGIVCQAFVEDCVTRSGSIIRAPGRKEVSILGLDSEVSRQATRDCVEYLRSQRNDTILAICGSIPRWESETWSELRAWLPDRPANLRLAVDTYGPPLQWLAQQRPQIIKINRDELETFFDEDVAKASTEELLYDASDRYDCPHWVITDGRKRIWLRSDGNEAESLLPHSVECASPTGCGDVFFATVLDSLYNRDGYDLKDAAERAADYASRSAASPGIADFEL